MAQTVTAYPATRTQHARNLDDIKERIQSLVAIQPTPDDGYQTHRELVIIKCWMTRSRDTSRIYCSIWVQPDPASGKPHTSGHGYAAGFGYHRASAALARAIDAAGIRVADCVDGRGNDAMREAARAIAEHVADPNGQPIIVIES